MSRMPVTVRCAVPEDAPELREIWSDVLRRAAAEEQLRDLERIIADTADDDVRSLVVAECGGELAGAVYLEASTLTPLNLEPSVMALSPHVLPGFRRRGVGTALMDAAVRFAEEHGIGHIASAAMTDSRDGNRFMARLSLVPQAMLRISTTQAVRAKLSERRAGHQRSSRHPDRRLDRHIDKVLAARRGRRSDRRDSLVD